MADLAHDKGSRDSFESITLASSSSATVVAINSVTGMFSSIEEKYRVDPSVIGTGYQAYAVRECVDRATGRHYAVKSVKKSSPRVKMTDLHREVNLLKEMNHDNILRLVDVYEDSEYVHIVTDLYKGGELYQKIVEKRKSVAVGCFEEGEAATILRQIIDAVSYLHRSGICHRDLKPENIMFETDEEGSPIKIIDFGLSRKHFQDSFEPYMSTVVGSTYFLAPEVLRMRYDRSCDLWAVGVTAYIMFCGYPPFGGTSNKEVREAIRRGRLNFEPKHWKGVSKDAKDFIRGLLRPNPRKRMSAESALKHPWIVGHSATASNEDGRQYVEAGTTAKLRRKDSVLSFRRISKAVRRKDSMVSMCR